MGKAAQDEESLNLVGDIIRQHHLLAEIFPTLGVKYSDVLWRLGESQDRFVHWLKASSYGFYFANRLKAGSFAVLSAEEVSQ